MTAHEARPGDEVTEFIRKVTSTMAGDVPASEVPVAPPYTETGLSRLSIATHPYRPAERIAEADLAYYYGDSPDAVPSKKAWKDVELALAGVTSAAGALRRQAAQLEVYCRSFSGEGAKVPEYFGTEKDMKAWYGAAMLRSFLPGFLQRIDGGGIDTDTANLIYRSIVGDVMPAPLGVGIGSECAIAALAARTASLTADPSSFFWLSSPREATSKLVAPDGSSYNHDFYRLAGAPRTKIPTEIKAHANTTRHRYYPGVTIVPVAAVLGEAVLGDDFEHSSRRDKVQLMPRILAATQQLMAAEIEQDVRLPQLDQAARVLTGR